MRIYYKENGIMVRQAYPSDADVMADRLRKTDVDEVWASNLLTPWEALYHSIVYSTMAMTITKNNLTIGTFGISAESLLGKKASIWFLATDDLDRIRYRFLRHSRGFIRMFLCFYPFLHNFVDARNTSSIEWLKFCGAKIEPAQPYGEMRMLFHYFSFRQEN